MLAAAVPDRLSLLKHRQAHGSHIYIRIGSVGIPHKDILYLKA
jgi:hypothetical protein